MKDHVEARETNSFTPVNCIWYQF